MSQEVRTSSGGGGCFGCLTFILFVMTLWALLFGVTVDDTHYEIECNAKQGVYFEEQ